MQPHLRLIEVRHEVDTLLIARFAKSARRNGGVPRGITQKRIASREVSASPMYLAIHRFELVVHYKQTRCRDVPADERSGEGASIADAAELAYGESTLTAEECQQHIQSSFALFAALGWFCKPGQLENEEGS